MRKFVDKILSSFLVGLMGLMVLNVLWQVISRYLLNDPSTFTDEIAGFMLMWLGLLGASYATGQGLHLSIDLLSQKFSEKHDFTLEFFTNLMVIAFALLVMVIGGGRLVYITLSLKQTSSNLSIPLGYVYAVLPLSGSFIIFYCISNIQQKFKLKSTNANN
ncbi:TRAP transporter small permease [Fulvivirgaceae bacterium BMA10]|uniref:TRAP transporter small permease n=1 Tax=Splendidivirga corallicola TaxID=3051826 RepID=A0ABT8KWC2_9BACT|nr:TRAP transporter small permease [Fulvivirgaceae bacterium BMA10]